MNAPKKWMTRALLGLLLMTIKLAALSDPFCGQYAQFGPPSDTINRLAPSYWSQNSELFCAIGHGQFDSIGVAVFDGNTGVFLKRTWLPNTFDDLGPQCFNARDTSLLLIRDDSLFKLYVMHDSLALLHDFKKSGAFFAGNISLRDNLIMFSRQSLSPGLFAVELFDPETNQVVIAGNVQVGVHPPTDIPNMIWGYTLTLCGVYSKDSVFAVCINEVYRNAIPKYPGQSEYRAVYTLDSRTLRVTDSVLIGQSDLINVRMHPLRAASYYYWNNELYLSRSGTAYKDTINFSSSNLFIESSGYSFDGRCFSALVKDYKTGTKKGILFDTYDKKIVWECTSAILNPSSIDASAQRGVYGLYETAGGYSMRFFRTSVILDVDATFDTSKEKTINDTMSLLVGNSFPAALLGIDTTLTRVSACDILGNVTDLPIDGSIVRCTNLSVGLYLIKAVSDDGRSSSRLIMVGR